jgi:hypothetical protein
MPSFLERIMGTLRYGGLELHVQASKTNIIVSFAFSLCYVTSALATLPLFFEACHS